MIVLGQDKKQYDIYTFCLSGKAITCRDNSDRRINHFLGVYDSRDRATTVFNEMRNCVDGYYEMPKE